MNDQPTSPFQCDANLISLLTKSTNLSAKLNWQSPPNGKVRPWRLTELQIFGWKENPGALEAINAQIEFESAPASEVVRLKALKELNAKTRRQAAKSSPAEIVETIVSLSPLLGTFPACVALETLAAWTRAENLPDAEWFPAFAVVDAELTARMQLRDKLSAFIAGVSNKTQTGGQLSDGRQLKPSGAVLLFINDCSHRNGPGWVENWLGRTATFGEKTVYVSAFAKDRIMQDARALVAKHEITIALKP